MNTFEAADEMDIPALQKEIETLELELTGIRARLTGYLSELGYAPEPEISRFSRV